MSRLSSPIMGIKTILICSVGLAILALAATLNAHVRNARPIAEVENEQL